MLPFFFRDKSQKLPANIFVSCSIELQAIQFKSPLMHELFHGLSPLYMRMLYLRRSVYCSKMTSFSKAGFKAVSIEPLPMVRW